MNKCTKREVVIAIVGFMVGMAFFQITGNLGGLF